MTWSLRKLALPGGAKINIWKSHVNCKWVENNLGSYFWGWLCVLLLRFGRHCSCASASPSLLLLSSLVNGRKDWGKNVCYFARVDHGPKKLSKLRPQQLYWYDAPLESTETTLLSEFVGEDDHTPHNRALCWMHSEELNRKEGRDFCVKAFLSCRLFFWPLPLASWPSTKRSWVTSTATPRAKHNIAMRGYDEIAGTSGRIWRCWADEVAEVDEITVMKWWGSSLLTLRCAEAACNLPNPLQLREASEAQQAVPGNVYYPIHLEWKYIDRQGDRDVQKKVEWKSV